MCVPTNLLTPGIDMHLTFELDLINWITCSTYPKRYLFLIKMFFLLCTFLNTFFLLVIYEYPDDLF